MDKIEELLTRGVDNIYPSKAELEKILRSGKKLTLYQGFDPTGTQLHIGHMVGFMKLRQWQELGHHVIFLIGDGTGQAGDPSGKTKSRDTFFTRDQLRKNATDYVKQTAKIVKFDGKNPVEIKFNGDWLNKLGLVDILGLAGHFSLQQLSERDLFQERIKKGEDVNLREFLYPLLQGYDSVAMKVDLEIGGSDQMFNMLCGRKLVKEILNKDKFVMTTPLLADSTGKKIGKTEGNVMALTDSPENLFGKLMSLPDEVIIKGFEYLTIIPMEEIKTISKQLQSGVNPIQLKKQLAYTITEFLNDKTLAQKAQENFEQTVQKKELPTEVSTIEISAKNNLISYIDLLLHSNFADSRGEAKRLIEQGGVEIDTERISDPNGEIKINDEILLKVGKRKFIKIKIK